MKGSTYRRCYCRGDDGKPLGKACPSLSSRRHGTWAVRQELPARADGSRRSFSRSGYETAAKAQDDLDKVRALLDVPDSDDEHGQVAIGDLLEAVSKDKKAPLPDLEDTRRRFNSGASLSSRPTVGEWLEVWLRGKKTRRLTTKGYESHVRVHLQPRIGHIRLDRLNVGHLTGMFDGIKDDNEVILAENAARREQEARATWGRRSRPPAEESVRLAVERARLEEMPPYRRVTGPATRQAIRRTLRTALNSAISQQLITFNPAAHVELETAPRPTGLLWTSERIARWQATGEIPSPVMVWSPAQLGQFLDEAESHRLYPLFHLITHHGLRRGEGVGQNWTDVHLDGAQPRVDVTTTIVVDGYTPFESAPKTEKSASSVMIDNGTATVLKEHRVRQLAERNAWNERAAQERAEGLDTPDWTDSGKVFTNEDGTPLHPDVASREFDRILEAAGLPPVNLRDTRHGAAGLVKAGGGDLHDAKAKLRHSTITLTSDTYMALFTEYEHELTERAAAAVPRARRKPDAGTSAHASLTQTPESDRARTSPARSTGVTQTG